MQILPPLSESEYNALKSDIASRGIQVPVELDENGDVLDGNSRLQAWKELRAEGVKVPDYPRIVRSGMTDGEKRNHARSLNIIRRHLTKEQLEPIWSAMRDDGMTYQAIADASGVSKQAVIRSVGPNGPTQPEKVIGKDGKRYPPKKVRKKASIFANDQKQQERAMSVAGKIDDAPDKVLDVRRSERIAREQENKKLREENHYSTSTQMGEIEIKHGAFPDILSDIKDGTVDLICTDPPYSREFLPQWEELFSFAARALKPGGFLVTYCGQSILEEIMKRNGHLEYIWTLAQVNASSKKNINHQRHIYSHWKPVLVFCKPDFKSVKWTDDLINTGNMEKELHDWQQGQREAEYIINNFSTPDSLVVDPFMGSGTTAVAAQLLGRSFIGCDIDAACVSKTLERLNAKN